MATRDLHGRLARDPVSELFDGPARRLLERAYARPGEWVSTRLGNPSPRHFRWALEAGVNLLGPDPVETASGRHHDARTAWARAFIRAIYYQHRWYGRGLHMGAARRVTPNRERAVVFEVGRMVAPTGRIPMGRQVRIKVLPGGREARHAVAQLPDSRRIFEADGRTGGAWADPSGRAEWEQ